MNNDITRRKKKIGAPTKPGKGVMIFVRYASSNIALTVEKTLTPTERGDALYQAARAKLDKAEAAK
jgi:hypothetical protein